MVKSAEGFRWLVSRRKHMLEAWIRTIDDKNIQYTRNVGEAGSVFTAQIEGDIIVHTGFAQGQLTREQVEERFEDVVGG